MMTEQEVRNACEPGDLRVIRYHYWSDPDAVNDVLGVVESICDDRMIVQYGAGSRWVFVFEEIISIT